VPDNLPTLPGQSPQPLEPTTVITAPPPLAAPPAAPTILISARTINEPPTAEPEQPSITSKSPRRTYAEEIRARKLRHARRRVDRAAARAEDEQYEDDLSNGHTEPEVQADDGSASYDAMVAFANRLGALISETPEERQARLHAEREAAFEAAGETKGQRRARHRADRLEREHRSSAVWRVPNGERARRFRRWCALTALSASAGYAIHVVQFVAQLPYGVGVGTLVGTWGLDMWLRGWGHVRVGQVRGLGRVVLLVLTRIPVSSALAADLGLGQLLAASGHLIHH
jgi:hypothetical protein